MKKIGVAVDDYKVPAFERGIKEAGFEYKTGPGVTSDTKLISVQCEVRRLPELARLIKELNLSATKSSMN